MRKAGLWHVALDGAGRPWPEDRDRYVFLSLVRRALRAKEVRCVGWCLKRTGAHLLVEACGEDAVREAVEEARREYARYWRGWYAPRRRALRAARAVAVPAELAWDVLAWVETEPVRAGLCGTPEDYRWSSAAAHGGWGPAYVPVEMERWGAAWSRQGWRERLREWKGDLWKQQAVARLLARARPLRALGEQAAEPGPGPLFQQARAARAAAAGWA